MSDKSIKGGTKTRRGTVDDSCRYGKIASILKLMVIHDVLSPSERLLGTFPHAIVGATYKKRF